MFGVSSSGGEVRGIGLCAALGCAVLFQCVLPEGVPCSASSFAVIVSARLCIAAWDFSADFPPMALGGPETAYKPSRAFLAMSGLLCPFYALGACFRRLGGIAVSAPWFCRAQSALFLPLDINRAD